MTARSQTAEEYLEAIFKLQRSQAPLSVRRLAEELGVSPQAASEMVARLRAAGLVREAGAGGGVSLSEQGEAEGAALVRRHRLSERFLSDYLNLPWDAVHEEACKLEHVLSPEVEARLAAQLGHPETCPHGHAIPDEDGVLHEVPTRPLSDLGPGERAEVHCVAEEDPELLRYLASLGLVPGTEVTVESVAPFRGPLLVSVGGTQYALGREVAAKVRVRG